MKPRASARLCRIRLCAAYPDHLLRQFRTRVGHKRTFSNVCAMLLMTCSADVSSATPPQMQSDFMKILIQIKARRLQRTYVSPSAVEAASVLKGGPCLQVRSRRTLKCRRSARRTQRPAQPTPNSRDTFAQNSEENLQSHPLLARCLSIVAGELENDHCP